VLLVGFIFVLVADAVSIMFAYWAWIIGREAMSVSRDSRTVAGRLNEV